VALPLIADAAKRALAELAEQSPDADSAVDVVVPVNFTLPHVGKLIALGFIPFAGWLTGFEMSLGQYPLLLLAGLPSMFAEVIALPFLLDLMQIPADTFQLFVALDVSTGRFGQLLGGAHTLAMAFLVAGGAVGLIRVRKAALVRYLVISGILTVGVVGGLRALYETVLPHEYEKDEGFMAMTLASEPVDFVVRDSAPEGERTAPTRLDEVVGRGVLRVGFVDDSLPNAYTNAGGELVGLDVDLANVLAREMGVRLEFVPVDFDSISEMLEAGRIDLMMSGFTVTPERMLSVKFSEPYMKATMSFVVRDHLRSKFSEREDVQTLRSPRIGVLDTPYYVDTLRTYLPNAEIVTIASPGDYFEGKTGDLDALFLSAERGSAWSLIHPEFSVAIPQPDVLAAPVAIGMAPDAEHLADFIDAWIRLKREDGTIDGLYRHWILGAGAKPKEPRWSVLRDVLGWVE
jgi:ABC-type amino acid transport substrate-binding protein